MTQASEKITQQYKDGGVIPAQLVGQDAVSKTYVDEQLAIRDTKIDEAKSAANAAQADINDHEASTKAHPAQNITYSGAVTGAVDVKQAIDAVKTTLDQAMISGDSGPEALAARYSTPQNKTYPSLKDRLDFSDVQLADLATEKANLRWVDVRDHGAVGDGVTDDTLAFKDAISAAIANKMQMYIPRPSVSYLISDTLLINKQIDITSDHEAILNFSILDNKPAIKIAYNANHGHYSLPKIVGRGQGVGIEINSVSVINLYVTLIDNFDTGLLLKSESAKCLDNTIEFDLIGNVRSGLKLITTPISGQDYTMEGNWFKFNFITGCQYGIHVIRSVGAPVMPYNRFDGAAIHSTKPNGACFYSEGGPITSTKFEITGYVGANDGVIMGGDSLFNTETNFFAANNCTFILGLQNTKIRLVGGNTTIKNLLSYYGGHSQSTPLDLVTTAQLANFNGGSPVGSNIRRVRMTLPIGTTGNQRRSYYFHSFCSHGYPKYPTIIYDYSSPPVDFVITARDISNATNFCIEVIASYTKDITTQRDITFTIGFE